jgi:glycosyltransferase involved in cell wall biosynthesis
MKVLMITGDKNVLVPGTNAYNRLELQRSAVDELVVMFWGHGSIFPRLPHGHFDIVTVQDPFWRGLFAWFIACKLRARFNVQVHTDLDAQPLVRHVLSQIVLLHAEAVRVVSEKIKNQVIRIGVRAPVHVLPIYVDISTFGGLVHKPHPHFNKTILWYGRFEDEKDPLYALEVLKQVHAQNPDAGLIMLGKGSLEKDLHRAAAELGSWVEFVPWQDPKSYLQMADVVLCTSKHESFGASIVEALAAGIPVAAPDVGIAREAGAIVTARNDLATKVIEVLQDGARGKLQIQLKSKEDWVRAWRETLQ